MAFLLLVSGCSGGHGLAFDDADASDSGRSGNADSGTSSQDSGDAQSATHDAGGDKDSGSTFFSCAATTCDSATEYCTIQEQPSDGGVVSTGWCQGYPTACGSKPSCSCISMFMQCTCSQSGRDITVQCN